MNGSGDKCLALLFSFLILVQAYLIRRYTRTWLFPACLFGLFWFGYTFIPLMVLYWIPSDPYAVGFILLCCVAFSVSSLPFNWCTAFRSNRRNLACAVSPYGGPVIVGAFYVSTFASLLFLALDLSDQGISWPDLLFDLKASAATYARLLYTESLNDNIYERLSMLFAYVGPIFAGLIVQRIATRVGRVSVVVVAFLPSVLVAVTQTTKGLLFFCIVLFYAGTLACRLSVGQSFLFEKGSARSFMWSSVVILPIVTGSFLLRGLSDIVDRDVLLGRLLAYFASYSCGHLYAFSDWFAFFVGRHSDFIYSDEGVTYGYYTFTNIFKLFGSHKILPQGVFDDYYTYGELLTTNVFTMFRGLIVDFGLAGSVIMMGVAGLLSHCAFFGLLVFKRPVVTVAIFVFMVGFFYHSFVISVLSWNRFYVAFVVLCVVLWINRLFARRACVSVWV